MHKVDEPELYTTCPHCGHHYALPFSPIERQIIDAVAELNRHSPSATAEAIAFEVSLHPATVRRHLNEIEKTGQIKRIGQRGGWKRAA